MKTKLSIVDYLFISAIVFAGLVGLYAFFGADYGLPGAQATAAFIKEKYEAIGIGGTIGIASFILRQVQNMKKSTNFAIGGLETTKGELKEVVNIIKEQARENAALRAEIGAVKEAVCEVKDSEDTLKSVTEYILTKSSNDPQIKDIFLKVRQRDAERKLDAYVEKKTEKAKRGLVISRLK
jgi:hypothetical protein